MAGKIVAWALLAGVMYLGLLALQILILKDGGLYLVPVLISMAGSWMIGRRYS